MRFMLLFLLALTMPAMAPAQPAAAPHADLPSDAQPVRKVPTTGYTLALSWAPEYCHAPTRRSSAECADRATRSGFTLHGLWPDGEAQDKWPQYCHPVGILTPAQIRAGSAATPSAQLLQHEWAKHGSCTGDDPVAFFTEEGRLFRAIRYPDMATLAHRRGLMAGAFQAAFAAANPGMRADMMRLNVNKNGWLEEVWLCLGLDKRTRTCPAGQGGAQPGDPIKVQAAS
jgi:ribonuclease T2